MIDKIRKRNKKEGTTTNVRVTKKVSFTINEGNKQTFALQNHTLKKIRIYYKKCTS